MLSGNGMNQAGNEGIMPSGMGVMTAQPPPLDGAQQYCLRWNSYPATIATQLASLRLAEDFVDVTLACEGQQLRAHKIVLSACSPYFMQLFKVTVGFGERIFPFFPNSAVINCILDCIVLP